MSTEQNIGASMIRASIKRIREGVEHARPLLREGYLATANFRSAIEGAIAMLETVATDPTYQPSGRDDAAEATAYIDSAMRDVDEHGFVRIHQREAQAWRTRLDAARLECEVMQARIAAADLSASRMQRLDGLRAGMLKLLDEDSAAGSSH
jgi:hypothetical protein